MKVAASPHSIRIRLANCFRYETHQSSNMTTLLATKYEIMFLISVPFHISTIYEVTQNNIT